MNSDHEPQQEINIGTSWQIPNTTSKDLFDFSPRKKFSNWYPIVSKYIFNHPKASSVEVRRHLERIAIKPGGKGIEIPHERTLVRWLRQIKSQNSFQLLKHSEDEKYEWPKSHERSNGLPWEAASVALTIAKNRESRGQGKLSLLQAEWAWKIHKSCPGLPISGPVFPLSQLLQYLEEMPRTDKRAFLRMEALVEWANETKQGILNWNVENVSELIVASKKLTYYPIKELMSRSKEELEEMLLSLGPEASREGEETWKAGTERTKQDESSIMDRPIFKDINPIIEDWIASQPWVNFELAEKYLFHNHFRSRDQLVFITPDGIDQNIQLAKIPLTYDPKNNRFSIAEPQDPQDPSSFDQHAALIDTEAAWEPSNGPTTTMPFVHFAEEDKIPPDTVMEYRNYQNFNTITLYMRDV